MAIKVIYVQKIMETPRMLQDLENEVRVHWKLSECNGVLQMREIFEDEQFIYLVLDYQSGGSLLDHLMKF